LAEFRAAERMQASLEREHPLWMEVRGWIVLTQALKGDRAAPRAALAAMGTDEREAVGPHLADAALRLADGLPEEAVDVLAPLLDGTPKALTRAGRPSTRCCWMPPRATGSATPPPPRRQSSARSSWPSRTGSSCRSC
jgi:hypothetical protein